MTAERVCRAITTLHQMLSDRGEPIHGLEDMSDKDIEAVVTESDASGIVRFDTGARDIIFFTSKVKTADIAKAASETGDLRKVDAILVTMDPIMTVHMRSVSNNFGPLVETFTLSALSINISRHTLVPKHELVDRDTFPDLKRDLGVAALAQLPLIESSDPMARYVRARPGDVVKITRLHPAGGTQFSYRFCRK